MDVPQKDQVKIPLDKPIVLFDGVCNLCNNLVQFIIKRDKKGKIRFAALQSEIGQSLLDEFELPLEDFDTAIIYENGKIYDRSSMGLRLSRHMDGLWPLCYAFIIIPKPIRDIVYNWIARNRYRWFGKRESCMMPTPELKARFL